MKEKIRNIKTTGHYNYAHILPNKLVYFGMSQQQPYKRWKPCNYKGMSLYSYIQEYGWKNIKHIVIQDGLTKEQAQVIEDWLIQKGKADGFCINERRSGGLSVRNRQEYDKQPERKAYIRQYDQRPEVKEHKRQYNQRPEIKVYMRVKGYNRTHTPIETPLEAKRNYLESGYIPNYIKSDDL